MNTMHVALTGISGFIGSFIARELKRRGHTVTGLVRESSRRDHIEGVCDRFVVGTHDDTTCLPEFLEGADALIHNSVDFTAYNDPHEPTRHLETNLLGSLRLLEASAPIPFVFMSSVAVHHDMRPRWEGFIDEDHPTRPSTLYGASKAAVEPYLWDEHFRTGRRTVAIRPSAVYGIDPTIERSRGHEFLGALRADKPITQKGGGKFVHVEDVAIATVNALSRDAVLAMPVNLVDCYARWGDVAQMGREILGSSSEIDLSSPETPKNTFSKELALTLAPEDEHGTHFMNRGHDGLRAHMKELIDLRS